VPVISDEGVVKNGFEPTEKRWNIKWLFSVFQVISGRAVEPGCDRLDGLVGCFFVARLNRETASGVGDFIKQKQSIK